MQTRAPTKRVRLVAFDLDGTITRGQTVCEAIACRLGRSDRMRELERSRDVHELTAARHEMAGWYLRETRGNLCAALSTLEMAPGALEAFEFLRSCGVKTAIISITWDFAVEWFRERLQADYGVGPRLPPLATQQSATGGCLRPPVIATSWVRVHPGTWPASFIVQGATC